jgi:hypothetical protein
MIVEIWAIFEQMSSANCAIDLSMFLWLFGLGFRV